MSTTPASVVRRCACGEVAELPFASASAKGFRTVCRISFWAAAIQSGLAGADLSADESVVITAALEELYAYLRSSR